jgi:glycosyltransferase involved in cell wall biosynthesis
MRRILISAYGCEPGKGSEQGVGWHWCMQLARLAEVVVLTRSNNQAAIEAALPEGGSDHIRFEFYDLPPVVRRFKRKEKGLYFYYLLWQWGAYRRARQLVSQSSFDCSMHLTFGSIWMPTFLHRLPLPFIWGPVGGGEAVPFRLIGTLPPRGRIAQYLRYGLMATMPLNPFIFGILRRSRLILTRTENTAGLIPPRYASKVHVVLETAMADDLLDRRPARNGSDDAGGVLRVIYTGRLVALKNVAAAIHAVAHATANCTCLRLVIIGDGPLRPELQLLAKKLNIAEKVEFRGTVPQAEVIDALANSDVYLFPSLKEGGVWSLMEAMSMGLPSICVKTSGMEVITDDTSAIRIEPVSQQQMIEDFASALEQLAKSPALRRQLGDNARKRIKEHFLWRHKGEFMASLFDKLEHTAR